MKKPALRKWHKVLVGIILFFTIILFAAPRVAKRYIVKHSQDFIGRNLDIDKIRLNYFTGTLRIEGLTLFEKDAVTAYVSFKKFKININYLPLIRNEYFVKYVYLDDPYVQVIQNGDKFNFSDLIESDTTAVEETPETDTIPSEPAKFIINDIRISRGYVKYTDEVLDHTIAMNNLDLQIPGFTWNSDSTNLDINFRFVDGGGLYSNLSINQADSTYNVALKLDSLNLDIVEPYAKSSLYISDLKGYLSNDLQIKGDMRNIMQLFVRGVNHIYGLQVADTLNRTIFSFNDLAIDIDTIQLDRNRIDLNSITIKDPFILFELIDTTNNLLALIKPSEAVPADSLQQADTLIQPPADTVSKSAEFSYTFPKLEITGGKIQFADKTMRYPFEYTVNNLKIESTEKRGKLDVNISAVLNGTGALTTNALVNPDNFEDIDIDLSIGQFRMKDLEAYFMHYFGYPVAGGIMNFKTENQIRPKSLISNNSLYFRKFTLAERTDKEAEMKLPLRLALGILSDKDGIIDLKAPVESKGDEVKVKNLGKIIFRIIGNLFIKAAVSPFNALSGSYNIDPAKLQEIRLELLEPSPDEENLKSVDIISNILFDKPGLNLDLYYCIDRAEASDSLAYMLAIEDFRNYRKSTGENVRIVADSVLLKYLLEKPSSVLVRDKTDLKALSRYYIGTDKLDVKLDSIRTLQTGFINNYLGKDKAVPAERFRIISTAPDTIKPPLNYPVFRVYFTAGGDQ
jgi:hypothetical protein